MKPQKASKSAVQSKEELMSRFEGLILSGAFAAGSRLPPEREFAAALGASRPVVHAALVELEARGLVLVRPRKGVYVSDWRRSGSAELLLSILAYNGGDLSPSLFDGLLEMRILFETETARLAALRRKPEQLAELEKAYARERIAWPATAVGSEGYTARERSAQDRVENTLPVPEESAALDFDFHLAVAMASGNDVYPLLMNSLKRIYLAILARFYGDEGVTPRVLEFHRALVAAIAAGDSAESSRLMRAILDYGERILRRARV
jgi:GntR family transcriptional repressor for pyruvate dehydrogenase complex